MEPSIDEMNKLIHELKTHQVELEVQNEELKSAYNELHNSKIRYMQLYHLAPVGYLTLDRNGIILQANQTIAEMLSSYIPDLFEKPFINFLTTSSQRVFLGLFRSFFKNSEKNKSIELDMIDKNGSIITVLLSTRQVEKQSGNKLFEELFIIIKDISDRKLYEEKLKDREKQLVILKEEAIGANIAKSLFLTNMSHEIRTPLNAINGFAQILLSEAQRLKLENKFSDYIKNIITSGSHLLSIINDILDLSRIESGKLELVKEPVSIRQLMKEIYTSNRNFAKQRSVELIYQIDDSGVDVILTDSTRLTQIIVNLVNNAIKFTPASKKVSFNLSVKSNTIVFEVNDEGIGIEESKLDKIFEPFEQLDFSRNRQYGGIGLGLSITKKLVSLLNGSIEVKSKLNEGSLFVVKVPFEKYNRNLSVDNSLLELNLISRKKIMIVEDNELNLEMILAFFEHIGVNSVIARNGKEATLKVLSEKPDLIIMDIHMPEMDGLEATKIIRENKMLEKIPIIGLTADAFIESKRQALSLGMNDYITKPIDFSKFIELLKKYLYE